MMQMCHSIDLKLRKVKSYNYLLFMPYCVVTVYSANSKNLCGNRPITVLNLITRNGTN